MTAAPGPASSRERLGLYPWPQWLQPGEGGSLWRGDGGPARLWLGEACRPVAAGVASVAGAWGVSLQQADAAGAAVVVGGLTEPPVAARLAAHPGLLAEPLPAEGYVLVVDAAGITVGGADARGCLYGLSTAAQLLGQAGGCEAVPYLELRDWPYKPMRGAHVYMPAREGIPFFKRFLAWLASLKYNTLFLEVGGGMRYRRHPEVNEGWAGLVAELRALPGGPPGLFRFVSHPTDSPHTEVGHGGCLEQSEVADLLAYAGSLGIEVIPELQALSHAYYMLAAHRELAERAWDPWPDTYCVCNPASYRIYFDLLDEVIEVFRPRMVHIGHDEAYTFGICDRCREKSGAELLAYDLNRIHDHLAALGVRTVLWADKLENIVIGGDDEGGRARQYVSAALQTDFTMLETYQAVDFVPKDMLAVDWYWSLDPRSERYLQAKGFEVIFGNFGDNYQPQAFRDWDKRSAGDGVVGAEVSTWCDLSEYALGHNLSLFNLLFSANMLWWRHYGDREREATLAAVARLQPWARQALTAVAAPSLLGRETRPLSLLPALNAVSDALVGTRGGWTGATPVPFATPLRAARVSAESPESRAIPVGGKAAAIVFLHHCRTGRMPMATWTIPDPLAKDKGSLLGYYLITYADGSRERIELRHGDNVAQANAAFGDDAASTPFWALPAWEGRDRESARVTLWAHEWVNPHPEMAIADVRLHIDAPADDEYIELLAVTVVG